MAITNSRGDSSSETRSEQSQEQITSQPEPRQLEEHGEGRRRNERPRQGASGHPERDQSSEKGSQVEEVDRPDLEIEIDGKRIMIDLNWFEWIILLFIAITLVYHFQPGR
jgi:hypothetical protein